ncbi:hypothetical protein CHS0354_039358 [Potamilus streckersoni]|nr:hypothetical protein CHS0354_039358 [Potamilus streckersoni]
MSDVQHGNTSSSFRTIFSKYTYHLGVVGCILVVGSFSCIMWLQRNRRKREVVLFTRYPVLGVTKTRLIPELGSVGASVAQTYMTEHILSILKDLSVAFHNLDITVQYYGGTREDILYWLQRRTIGMNINFKHQKGEGLGVKLKNAVKESFSKGHDYVIVIGGDIPGISKEILLEAFTHLNNNADMVLGKAEDGGYYLVGFSKSATRYIDDIFSDISWGTSEVFRQQVLQAKQLGAKLGILTTVLQDVDNPDDLCVFERCTGVSVQNLKHPLWSIVIPTVNEGESIERTLQTLVQRCSSIDKLSEIIISDGGSTDNTVEKIKGFIATSPVPVKLIHSNPGRGIQLRAGAEQAVGEYLLFLHADTIVPNNFDKLAEQCLFKPGNVAGAFLFDLDLFHQDKC